MNILLLNWRDTGHPKSGGAERVTLEHAKGWAAAGHSVTWITSSYPGAKSNEVVDGVRMIRRLGTYSLFIYVPIYLLFRGGQHDVIVDEVHGFPFFSLLFTKKPVVVFIHEIAGDIWDYMFAFPKNKIGKLLERLYFILYKRCLFWTVAESTVEELTARGISRSQCVAIINPIIMPTSIEKILPKKESRPTYIFVSRVVRMKGIEEVIKAFSFIARSQKSAALWIVGNGENGYVRELKEMVREYGIQSRVKFFGFVPEKRKFELMGRAHLLLHASVKEGWGLVVLEASYMKTPSVVYNVPGLRDAVQDGVTGVVIRDNSPQEMARQATQLLSDSKRYRRFQGIGKRRVQSLSWKEAVRKSLAVLVRAKHHES